MFKKEDMKKGGKMLSDNEKKAKMTVMEAMRKMAEGEMGSRLKGMKKVTVAAPDSEGLEKGLETAQGLVGEMPEMESEDEMSDEEGMESPEMDMHADGDMEEHMSEDELDAKLEKLMAMKEKMKLKV